MGILDDSFVNRWHSVYFFMPIFEQPPKMPPLNDFLSAMTKAFGRVEPLAKEPRIPLQPSELLGLALWDHPAYYEKEKQSVPTQLVLYGPAEFDRGEWDQMTISQFWDCPDKEGFVARCRYSLNASNFMAANLPRGEQYQLIADYADLLLKLFPDCIGLFWPHSRRLVPREAFLAPHWNTEGLHFLDGGLNIRFFNLQNSNEMLFDTLGFAPLGLPDLQCHCKDLIPNDVVSFLRNLAVYLYQQGDVIEDGHTVEGIGGGKWYCQHEDAMVAPGRVVLDICPGKYAGGGRA